jgi:hypothetical protein
MYLKRFYSIIVFALYFPMSFGQNVDGFYLEDQVYVSFNYNMLVNKHDSILQGGFSNSFEIGYIRDIPLNKRRNFGVGVGLGYSIGHFYQNLDIKSYVNGVGEISLMESNEFIRNKFSISYLEIPFEIRYRTSTFDKQKFFRSYLGFKIGYMLRNYSKKKTEYQEIAYYNHPDINWWRYGITLKLGYGKWNLNMYYSLSNIFKEGATTTDNNPSLSTIPLDMNEFNIGLVIFLI